MAKFAANGSRENDNLTETIVGGCNCYPPSANIPLVLSKKPKKSSIIEQLPNAKP
jgi:hypothetical protein